jgi:hypothetical protein
MLYRVLLFLSLPLAASGILYSMGVTSFWTYLFTILFTVALQYAIDIGFQKFAVVRYGLQLKKINLEMEQEYNKRGMELICPCDEKHRCFVPIDLNQGTDYKCQKCEKNVSVYVKVGTALGTEPIVVQSLDALPLNLNE